MEQVYTSFYVDADACKTTLVRLRADYNNSTIIDGRIASPDRKFTNLINEALHKVVLIFIGENLVTR